MISETVREIVIDAPLLEVAALLSDPHGIAKIHPLIETIEITRSAEAGDRRVVDFDFVERIPLGPLHFPKRSRGRIESQADRPERIEGWAWSDPGLEVHATWTLTPEGTGTRGRQTVRISALAPLVWFATPIATRAHDAQAAAIQRLFARGRG